MARTTAVGPEIARRYGAPRPNVLETRVTLLERDQLAAGPRPDPSGQVELLTVGRVAAEKAPLTAVEALAELERREPGGYRLMWVGEGPLAGDMRRAAEAGGVADRLALAGFVPFGPELLEIYRSSDVLVHTALTEGVPGVLYEAMGSGLAIVATETVIAAKGTMTNMGARYTANRIATMTSTVVNSVLRMLSAAEASMSPPTAAEPVIPNCNPAG